MVGTSVRRTRISAGLGLAVLATVLNGVVVGYGVLWFQLFGDAPDVDDYRVSAGGYGAASLVLALAVAALLAHRAPAWLAWLSGASATVLCLLAVGSAARSRTAEQGLLPVDTVWDGIGGVLWAPWTWALVVLGLRGLLRLRLRAASLSRASSPRMLE